MSKQFEGMLIGKDLKFGIIASRFNEFITNKLLGGAQDALVRHGVTENNIDIAWVPGSFEIPLVAKKLAETKQYDAVICLGAVIRGATPHFEYVAAEVAKGIATVGLETGIPITFGIMRKRYFSKATRTESSSNIRTICLPSLLWILFAVIMKNRSFCTRLIRYHTSISRFRIHRGTRKSPGLKSPKSSQL